MPKEKHKFLKVTTTRQYVIPMIDDKHTQINGWTIDEVIVDWFGKRFMNSHHAAREGHEIGNTIKFVNAEVLDEPDIQPEEYAQNVLAHLLNNFDKIWSDPSKEKLTQKTKREYVRKISQSLSSKRKINQVTKELMKFNFRDATTIIFEAFNDKDKKAQEKSI